MTKLTTTGRAPSVDLDTLRNLLERYFDGEHASVTAISAEFKLCEATTRKYLRMAIGPLPRGKASLAPREAASVRTLLNGVSTEALLGPGRLELLARRSNEGNGVVALAAEFGISRRRVKAALASL